MTVYHDYIAPWFDRFIQLPEGNLRTCIEKLASSVEFPLTKILVIEGSKRSAHSNAYFFGFFKNKRIVLFDTLLKESPFEKERLEEERKEKERTQQDKKREADAVSEKEADEDEQKNTNGVKGGANEAENINPEGAEEESEKKSAKGCSDQEILAVLGHELGHWKMSHTIKNLVIAQVKLK